MSIPMASMLVLGLTIAQSVWLAMLGSQHSLIVLLATHFGSILLVVPAIWPKLRTWELLHCLTVGLIAGYLAATLSGAVTLLHSHGWDLARDRGLDLTSFPLRSLGWLYGAAVLALMSASKRKAPSIGAIQDRAS